MPALEGFSSGRCKRYSEAEAAPPARPPAAGAPAAHAERQDRPGPCPPPGPPPAGVGAIVAVRPRPPPGPPPGWRPRPGRADGATAPEHLCAALCPGDAHGDPAEGSRARGAVEAVVEYTVSYANQLAAPSEGPRRALDSVAVMSPPERRRFATRRARMRCLAVVPGQCGAGHPQCVGGYASQNASLGGIPPFPSARRTSKSPVRCSV